MPMSMKGDNERLVNDGIIVKGFTQGTIQAQATDIMKYPSLPMGARRCDKFKDDEMADPLVSVPQLAEHGCTIVMNDKCGIIYNQDNTPVLIAPYDRERRAYLVPLQENANPKLMTDIEGFTPMRHRAQSAYEVQAIPELINYYHGAAGYPVKDTWIKAIKKGHYIGWPGLTAKRVRRHLKRSPHTDNGHQHLIRQGIRSTTKPRGKKHSLGAFI